MASSFQKAQKEQARLRAALIGPAGSGKTYTGLLLAKHLGGKVAVIDTEHGSASKYADLFEFDTAALSDHSPENYISKIREAEAAGYAVLLIDSLTHEWKWCLEEVDNVKARMKTSNSFVAWKDITPRHNALTEAILQSGCHVIGTMRSKTEYVVEQIDGKSTPRKIGTAPVQRDGVEYEFDLIGDLDLDNTLVVSKTRCPELTGKVIRKPGEDLAATLKVWLGTGAKPKKAAPAAAEKTSKASGDGGGPTFEPPEGADGKVTREQHAKLHAICKDLHDTGVPIPKGFTTWNDFTKALAKDKFHVDSRADLTYSQMSELIATLDAARAEVAA